MCCLYVPLSGKLRNKPETLEQYAKAVYRFLDWTGWTTEEWPMHELLRRVDRSEFQIRGAAAFGPLVRDYTGDTDARQADSGAPATGRGWRTVREDARAYAVYHAGGPPRGKGPLAVSDDELADTLYAWATHLFDEGRPKFWLVYTLAGLAAFVNPLWVGSRSGPLARAYSAAEAFSVRRPATPQRPLLRDAVVAMASEMWACRFFEEGVVLLALFGGLARIGEVLKAKRTNLHLATNDGAFEAALATARAAGAREVDSKAFGFSVDRGKGSRGVEFVSITDCEIIDVLRAWFKQCESDRGNERRGPLWTTSRARVVTAMELSAPRLGLADRYLPHSLRAGAATQMHLDGAPISSIMSRGRWKSRSMAEYYVRHADAVGNSAAADQLTPAVRRRLLDVSRHGGLRETLCHFLRSAERQCRDERDRDLDRPAARGRAVRPGREPRAPAPSRAARPRPARRAPARAQ